MRNPTDLSHEKFIRQKNQLNSCQLPRIKLIKGDIDSE